MFKKMMLLAVSAAALVAFAAPAAQASVSLTNVNEDGIIVAHSTNTETTINATTALFCNEVVLVGEAAGGTISNIEGIAEPCRVTGGPEVIITDINAHVSLTTGGKGSANFDFLFDIPAAGLFECTETGNNIPVTYANTSDEITINGGPLVGAGAGCPAGAQGIHGDFTLTNSTGGIVTIHG